MLAVELQGHGHTGSIDRPPSFGASADDVAELLGELNLKPVDVFGFSNGGQVALPPSSSSATATWSLSIMLSACHS